jgi:hypothetical protein
MQLGNVHTIEALLASVGQPMRISRHRAQAVVDPKPILRAHKVPRCPSGCTCRTCTDNARWERIFQEKFADPGYYSNPTTRNWSSLSDC